MVKDIFQEVEKALDNYFYTSYHVYCSISEEVWSPDYSSVSFTVNFWNDQGEGSEWKEYWSIDQEGGYTLRKKYMNLSKNLSPIGGKSEIMKILGFIFSEKKVGI